MKLRFVDANSRYISCNCCSVCIDIGIQLEVMLTL